MKEKINFAEEEAMYYFTMILLGLYYLHGIKIILRGDLKPSNILIIL
jgi:serine/threonine protein kinase